MPELMFAPLAALGDRLAELGAQRVLVLASSERHLAPTRAALGRFDLAVFEGARVHVPAETVAAASAAFALARPDTIVAIGGGSPIGLGKALRLDHDARFVAVPTTYAGSEMTRMYGITRGRDKQTGRAERVRPDLVLYDVDLTLAMPLTITVQSLCNALAHVVSVLSTDSLAGGTRADGLGAARTVVDAIDTLVGAPADRAARPRVNDPVDPHVYAGRQAAQRGASACAAAFDLGKAGVQHALAHLLGGAFNLDHAALHALLLPQFLAHIRRARPELLAELELAIGEKRTAAHERPTIRDLSHALLDLDVVTALPRLGARIRGLLVAAKAPVKLSELGVDRAALEAVLATRPELPAKIALDAF